MRHDNESVSFVVFDSFDGLPCLHHPKAVIRRVLPVRWQFFFVSGAFLDSPGWFASTQFAFRLLREPTGSYFVRVVDSVAIVVASRLRHCRMIGCFLLACFRRGSRSLWRVVGFVVPGDLLLFFQNSLDHFSEWSHYFLHHGHHDEVLPLGSLVGMPVVDFTLPVPFSTEADFRLLFV